MWDREQDKFDSGSWFRGRIYTDCSDISPDGRHMIYFAMGGVAWAIPPTGGSWKAISTLPSLKAEALWGQGGGTRGGGGRFLSSSHFCLDADDNTFLIRDDSGLHRAAYDPRLSHVTRMSRDGWVTKGDVLAGRFFDKSLPDGWILRKIEKGGYELEHPGARTLERASWEWAEWDRHRLVWATGGRLQTACLESDQILSVRTLHDFNEDGLAA